MINIFCVLVKPKYTLNDVIRLYNMCKKHIRTNFKFICLTDRKLSYEDIEFINVDHYELDTWWNKVLIFNPDYNINETSLYFDLDLKINNDITHIINDIEDNMLTVVDTPWKNKEYLNQVSARVNTKAFLEYGNTSVMGWNKNSHSFLMDMLLNDIFKHAAENFGDDTFINRNGNIKYFKNVKIGYINNQDILLDTEFPNTK